MTAGVLLFRRELGKGPAAPLRNEKRIVAEAAAAAFVRRDKALDRTGESPDEFVSLGQSQNAAETPAPRRPSHLAHPLEQEQAVFLHDGPDSGKACRPHPGSTAQGIHLQTGIIGQNPTRVMRGGSKGLQFGIILESAASLIDFGQVGQNREILDQPGRSENFPHLARFVRVARGQEQALL